MSNKLKNKIENLRLKVFKFGKDCLALFNKLTIYEKAKLCLFVVVLFGVLEKVESLSISTQNNEIEIKYLKEKLSLNEQLYENEKKIESLTREKEINSLIKANEDTLKRYELTAVGFGIVCLIGFYSSYSDEIRLSL